MGDEPGHSRERKKARTHRAISEAAIALFLERGYDAVSVSEIAAVMPDTWRIFTPSSGTASTSSGDRRDAAEPER